MKEEEFEDTEFGWYANTHLVQPEKKVQTMFKFRYEHTDRGSEVEIHVQVRKWIFSCTKGSMSRN